MKTIRNSQYQKNLTITAAFAAFVSLCSFSQPKSETYLAYEESAARLEQFINAAEQSIRYVPPIISADFNVALPVSENELEAALQNLNAFADNTEKELRYKAPDEIAEEALQSLELFAEATTNSLKYSAPGEDEAIQAYQNNSPMRYQRSSRPVKVEFYQTPQDTWLINAGYCKSNRTPAWDKIMHIFSGKANEQHLADEL